MIVESYMLQHYTKNGALTCTPFLCLFCVMACNLHLIIYQTN